MERRIWILGHGPVVIHRQFELDIPRSKGRFKLNNTILSDNVFTATRLVYDTCDIHYYQYTKYINQTMGNWMVMYLQRIYNDVLIHPCHDTFIIRACYTEVDKYISAQMIVRLVGTASVRRVRCTCTYDIIKHNHVINLSY